MLTNFWLVVFYKNVYSCMHMQNTKQVWSSWLQWSRDPCSESVFLRWRSLVPSNLGAQLRSYNCTAGWLCVCVFGQLAAVQKGRICNTFKSSHLNSSTKRGLLFGLLTLEKFNLNKLAKQSFECAEWINSSLLLLLSLCHPSQLASIQQQFKPSTVRLLLQLAHFSKEMMGIDHPYVHTYVYVRRYTTYSCPPRSMHIWLSTQLVDCCCYVSSQKLDGIYIMYKTRARTLKLF